MAEARLQKLIARAGLASRREAEQWITAGRVRVDGQVIRELGAKADLAHSRVTVDGKPLRLPREFLYLALNKPRGCVTTLSDPEGRPTVMNFLRGVPERVYPVGRLDYQSEGLLLLTNDGDFANHVMNAGQIPKTYWVKVAGVPEAAQVDRLRKGIVLERRRTLPARIRALDRAEGSPSRKDSGNPWYEVVLREGRQNQIRRMFERIGHPVRKLKRVKVGGVGLGNLQPGEYRALRPAEVRELMRGAPKDE